MVRPLRKTFEIDTATGERISRKTKAAAVAISQAVFRLMLGQRERSMNGTVNCTSSVVPKTTGHRGFGATCAAAGSAWSVASGSSQQATESTARMTIKD